MYQRKLIKLIVRKESNCLTKSIQIGIDNSKFETICWMDADYSHHPKFLKNIIIPVMHQNFDVAVNIRRFFLRKDYKFLPGILSFFLNIFLRITLDFKFQDYTSGFICIKKKIFKNYKLVGDYGEYFVDLIYYCIKKKFKIKQIDYKEFPRASGTSKTGSNIFHYLKKGKKYISISFNALNKY